MLFLIAGQLIAICCGMLVLSLATANAGCSMGVLSHTAIDRNGAAVGYAARIVVPATINIDIAIANK